MDVGMLTMSKQELNRLNIIEQVFRNHLSQKSASILLNLSCRQVRRLQRRYEADGAAGLVSMHRGKLSNHQLPEKLKRDVLTAIEAEYSDFGPKLASECLFNRQDLKISVETARQWMIEAGFWYPKSTKGVRIHPSRERRSQFGELVQIDGSPHDWFEGRGKKCCLLVIIDDATSALLGLRFCKAETTQDYFAVVENYFKQYGLPMAMYSDKHSVFRINDKQHEDTRLTQFGRAMGELGVELIYASSPEAKGRVERANKTLQDRLIKLMRLEGISTIEEANAFLPSFIDEHNQQFAKVPAKASNAHSFTMESDGLESILSVKTHKKLNKNLSFQYEAVMYQIKNEGTNRLQNREVMLCERYDGEKTITIGEKTLTFDTRNIEKKSPEIHNEKTINGKLDSLILKATNAEKEQVQSNQPWFDYKQIERQMAFS